MGATIIRGLILVFGALVAVGGLAALAVGGEAAIAGLWGVVVGLVIMATAVLERSRYRSSTAETTSEGPGPGGGEPVDRPMEPRFRRTDERFIDPSTRRQMRVWVDDQTGERRYRAED